MNASLHFYGCSCGCTPGETIYVEADTKEALTYGLADQACNFIVRGDNPFRKVSFDGLKENGISRDEVVAVGNQLLALEREKSQYEDETKKRFVPVFVAAKGYALTPEQIATNQQKIDEHAARVAEFQRKVEEMKGKINAMYLPYTTRRNDDDE